MYDLNLNHVLLISTCISKITQTFLFPERTQHFKHYAYFLRCCLRSDNEKRSRFASKAGKPTLLTLG